MSVFAEPSALVRAYLDDAYPLDSKAHAALDLIERQAGEMETQATLDAERAAILSSAVGHARLLLDDASKETTALIDAALSAREESQ